MLREFYSTTEDFVPMLNEKGATKLVPRKVAPDRGLKTYPKKWEVWDNGVHTGWMIPADPTLRKLGGNWAINIVQEIREQFKGHEEQMDMATKAFVEAYAQGATSEAWGAFIKTAERIIEVGNDSLVIFADQSSYASWQYPDYGSSFAETPDYFGEDYEIKIVPNPGYEMEMKEDVIQAVSLEHAQEEAQHWVEWWVDCEDQLEWEEDISHYGVYKAICKAGTIYLQHA